MFTKYTATKAKTMASTQLITLRTVGFFDFFQNDQGIFLVMVAAETAEETFQSFLKKFTSSASFQYTRVKFPLKTPITLMTDDGNSEKTFPFTQEKWPLLDAETLKEERITQEEGGIYVSKFTVNEPTHKEFEAGYEESEVDLRVIFDLIDGKWYVTDCYTGWYGYDLPIDDLNETVKQVKEENDTFKELHP